MMNPKVYIQGMKEKSCKELLEEKAKLNKKIEEFENNKSKISEIMISPEYQYHLKYMAELCNLITEKYGKNETQLKQNETKYLAKLNKFKDELLPQEEKFSNVPKCPSCNSILAHVIGEYTTYFCSSCKKYYIRNSDGSIGPETPPPPNPPPGIFY